MKKTIELKHICKTYKTSKNEVKAIDDISFTVNEGEFLSIVGRSGSGKSTLMNVLGCLDIPDSGKYYLNGKNVFSFAENNLSRIRNKEIGFIFQGFNLIPSLNAIENIELPLVYTGLPSHKCEALAKSALDSVGLLTRASHKPYEMSGGQQQRVAIARALANNPSLILADEPTGNLDSKSSNTVLELLNELNSKGKTIVMITHDNNLAKKTHRVLKINDGKLTN